MNFANTILLSFAEVKTNYLFPLFSSTYPSALLIIRYNGFTLLIFSSLLILYFDITNIINANTFVGFLAYFY